MTGVGPGGLEGRLVEALGHPALVERLELPGAAFWEARGGDAAAVRLEGAALAGLARSVATRPEIGSFLSHRPALFERICRADAGALADRTRELEAAPIDAADEDLESALDELRLLRREETCLASCVDLGGGAPFPAVSEFLSVVAEVITRRALHLAERHVEHGALSVLGMGKIAGREFTYHSDLDLIFLFEGGPGRIGDASRVGQRLIAYLTTMTGAGVAYAVDTRLRPSGQQGMLVAGVQRFERYQSEEAQTWEHVAVLRARVIAGDAEPARRALDRVHERVLAAHESPWTYLADLRERVEAERAAAGADSIAFKTGPGGLMDVDFLAGGGLLERGTGRFPRLPSVPAMLRASVRGPRVDALLGDYAWLRLLEARARWVSGRAVEALAASDDAFPLVAALLDLPPEALAERAADSQARIREAYRSVIAAGTIGALEA